MAIVRLMLIAHQARGIAILAVRASPGRCVCAG